MNNTIKSITERGKKVKVVSEARTRRGRVIEARMIMDGQAKNRIFITTEANRDYKETRIHFGSIDELRTFKKMIEDLEEVYEDHKKKIAK